MFYIPGVDRGNMKSLWTSNVTWMEVTEAGMDGGLISPDGIDGSAAKLERVRTNILGSGRIGSLVASDFRSSIISVPLLETDPKTGTKLDYGQFSEKLESLVHALGVFTWVWSDIKFQADMGLLLMVMFLWNMIGAIVMIPALATLLVPKQNEQTIKTETL